MDALGKREVFGGFALGLKRFQSFLIVKSLPSVLVSLLLCLIQLHLHLGVLKSPMHPFLLQPLHLRLQPLDLSVLLFTDDLVHDLTAHPHLLLAVLHPLNLVTQYPLGMFPILGCLCACAL